MQIHFASRTKARAFGKAVDNGANAARRWGVNVQAKARPVVATASTAFNENGSPVCVVTRRRGGAL